MLRSVCFSLSAFLLLGILNIQHAQAQRAVAQAVRAVRAAMSVTTQVRGPIRGSQAISNFTRNSRVLPELRAIMASNNIPVQGASISAILQTIEAHQANAQFVQQAAPLLNMLHREATTTFQADIAAARSASFGMTGTGTKGTGGQGLWRDTNANVNVIDVDVDVAQLEPQVADQIATERSNFRVVIGAVRDALMKRAADFGVPQFSGLAGRLHSHLTALADRAHLALLGSRAEECITRWEATYNTAVSNMTNILLAVRDDTSTYASAADQMLKAMHTLFGGVLGELQRRLNTLTSDRCSIYSPDLTGGAVAI